MRPERAAVGPIGTAFALVEAGEEAEQARAVRGGEDHLQSGEDHHRSGEDHRRRRARGHARDAQ